MVVQPSTAAYLNITGSIFVDPIGVSVGEQDQDPRVFIRVTDVGDHGIH
jgi:hypothetical protein